MKFISIVILVFFILFFNFLACDLDHGLEPIRSSIQGTIQYTGEWPGDPAEVRLVAATQFPPADVSDLIIGENIPPGGESHDFRFYLKPGIYKLLGIAWREQNSTWDLASICGLHFSGDDSLAPGELIVADEESTVKGIFIGVNRSEAHKVTDSQIRGSIRFNGTWPDSVEYVYAVASAAPFTIFPQIKLPTLLDLSFSQQIPPNSKTFDYTIRAFPATYYATGLIFFKSGKGLSADDINYSMSIGGLNFAPYTVEEDSLVAGPDFNINF